MDLETFLTASYATCGLVALGVLLVKAAGLRRAQWDLSLITICVNVALPGIAFLVAAPKVYRAIDSLTGLPNAATLIVYSAITATGCSLQVMLAVWSRDTAAPADWALVRELRPRLVLGAVTLTVLAALFLGSARAGEHPADFDTAFLDQPTVVAFLLVYQIHFAYSLLTLGRLALTMRRQPEVQERPWVVQGLGLIGKGAFVALGYCACKLAAVLLPLLTGLHADVLSTFIASQFASVGAMMMTLGYVTPVLRPRRQLRRQDRKIRPLWRTLVSTLPSARLGSPGRLVGGEWTASRRAAEVYDVQRELMPYAAPAAVGAARRAAGELGLSPGDGAVLADAAALRSGLDRFRTGLPPVPPQDRHQPDIAHLDDRASSLAYLGHLTEHFHGPTVTACVESAPPETPARDDLVRALARVWMPEDIRIGLALGLLRTIAVPELARTYTRIDDVPSQTVRTAEAVIRLVMQIMEAGPGTPTGEELIVDLRTVLHRYDIADDNLKYVLAVLVVITARWIDRVGWRSLTAEELDALHLFITAVGTPLGAELPGTFAELAQWVDAYDRRVFERTPEAERTWHQVRADYVAPLPRRWAPLPVAVAEALTDGAIREQLHARRAPWLARVISAAAMTLRARRLRARRSL